MISGDCTSESVSSCHPITCRWRCAIDVIDELLGRRATISDREADDLLDLRLKLLSAFDAEETLRVFCAVRRRMEQRHYLAFFRIRRWLENNIVVSVVCSPGTGPHQANLKLDHYCVEALRRSSLCAALRNGAVLDRPNLSFLFRPSYKAQNARAGDLSMVE